jgi:hypothetical protein
LGLLQFVDPAKQLALFQVDYSDAVVAQLGDEQALATEIDCHVVDPAHDIPERNLRLDLHW